MGDGVPWLATQMPRNLTYHISPLPKGFVREHCPQRRNWTIRKGHGGLTSALMSSPQETRQEHSRLSDILHNFSSSYIQSKAQLDPG